MPTYVNFDVKDKCGRKMNLELLKNMGVKVTKHKTSILQLFDTHKHLDANTIYNALNTSDEHVSLATIYRVLSTFEAHGVIMKHNFNEDQAVYELANPNEHHDHLICTKCNKVIEFFDCKLERIQERIAKENNFKIVAHQLNLYGICQECTPA